MRVSRVSTPSLTVLHLLAGACLLAGLIQSSHAQAQAHDDSTVSQAVKAKQANEIRRGDPGRWYQQDMSRQARLKTLQKEIGAAYAEAKIACREAAANERSDCLKQARATYEADMKNAPAQLDAAPAPDSAQVTQVSTQVDTPAGR